VDFSIGEGSHEKDADRFSGRNVRAVAILSGRSPKATDYPKDRLSRVGGKRAHFFL
jgi:hypothetical protein